MHKVQEKTQEESNETKKLEIWFWETARLEKSKRDPAWKTRVKRNKRQEEQNSAICAVIQSKVGNCSEASKIA